MPEIMRKPLWSQSINHQDSSPPEETFTDEQTQQFFFMASDIGKDVPKKKFG